jgi:hypothetical protein
VAGTLYAFLLYFAFPEVFFVLFSGDIVAMTIVGGMRNFFGPIVGGTFFVLFKDILSSITKNWMVFFGMIFMVFILFSPNGIMGIAQNIWERLRREGEGTDGPEREHEGPGVDAATWSEAGTPVSPELNREPSALSQEEIFRIKGLSKRFGALAALSDVNLSVMKGELRAIIGPNGAGKTTLFNVFTGLMPPDAGEVVFEGKDITGSPPYKIASQGIARSFQITSIFKDLTVFENVRVAVQAATRYKFSLVAPTDELVEINQGS